MIYHRAGCLVVDLALSYGTDRIDAPLQFRLALCLLVAGTRVYHGDTRIVVETSTCKVGSSWTSFISKVLLYMCVTVFYTWLLSNYWRASNSPFE